MCEHCGENEHGMPMGAFGIPEGLVRAIQNAGEDRRGRQEMAVHETVNTVYELLDSLTPKQLIGLRTILQTDGRSAPNNYIEGMVVTLLRVVHKVDTETGLSMEEQLAKVAAETPTVP